MKYLALDLTRNIMYIIIYMHTTNFYSFLLLLYRIPYPVIVLPSSACSPSSFADHTTTEIVGGLSKVPPMETLGVIVPGHNNTWPRPKPRRKKKVIPNISRKNSMIDQLYKLIRILNNFI